MKVSVVIPTFNRLEQTIAAVASALAQCAPDLIVEVIVVDDGSTDDSLAMIASRYVGEAVRIIANHRTKGPAGARNTGINVASGELIALLDSDDLFLPGHLAECASLLAANSDVGVVFGRARYEQDGQQVDYMGPQFERKLLLAPTTRRDDAIRIFDRGFFRHLLEHGCFFNLSTVVLRNGAARELMREELRIAEDYEFWVRLSRSHVFACVDRPQIVYALHQTNISFEAAGSTADHAPKLLSAYSMMKDCPNLSQLERRIINRQIAATLFDWGYRCRLRGHFGEAARLYLRSARFGHRLRTAFALLKLGVLRLAPRAVTS